MRCERHFTGNAADDSLLHQSFVDLQATLDDIARASADEIQTARSKPYPGSTPQKHPLHWWWQTGCLAAGFEFRTPFLDLLDKQYKAPLQRMDFVRRPEEARVQINEWVAKQTRKRIVDLIPQVASRKTRRSCSQTQFI